MQWKEYRLTRTRVATGEADGARRVVELLDGRHLVEREGAPSRIVEGTYEAALELALTTPRSGAYESALALARTRPGTRAPWWGRLWRSLFGGAS